MKKATLFILVIVLVIGITEASAQCSMCSAVVSSNMEGQAKATGINRGILFLMAFPYLLGMGFLYYFFRQKINAFASRLLKKSS